MAAQNSTNVEKETPVGVYELTSSLKTPLEVVISEYVDLTHAFYEKRTADLVNGVLDKLATVRKQKKFG